MSVICVHYFQGADVAAAFVVWSCFGILVDAGSC